MWGTNVRWTTCISHTETQMQCWKATLMLLVCLFAGLCVRNTHCTKTWRCCCWTLALCARQSSVAESLRYRRRKSSNLSSAINKRSRLPLVTEPMTSAWLKARDNVCFIVHSDTLTFICTTNISYSCWTFYLLLFCTPLKCVCLFLAVYK